MDTDRPARSPRDRSTLFPRDGALCALLGILLLPQGGCAKRAKGKHTGGLPLDSGLRPEDSGRSDTAADDSGAPDSGRSDTGDSGEGDPLERWSGEAVAEIWSTGELPGGELGARLVWSDAGLWVAAPGGGGVVQRHPDGPRYAGASETAHLGMALASRGSAVLAGAWSRDGGDEGAVYLLSADGTDAVVETDIAPLVVVPEGAVGMILHGSGVGEHVGGWLLGLPRFGGDRGRVVLYDADTGAEQAVWTGESVGNLAGGGLTTADLNGDGMEDLVVGAWGYSGFSGAVQVSFAPFDGETSLADADRMWMGDAFALAGFSLAVGDVDGDGQEDVVVGSFGDTRNGSGAGALTVVPGASDSAPLLDFEAHRLGHVPDAHFGSALSVADVDRDGCADITVGAPDASTGGVVQLHYGPIEGVGTTGDAMLVDPEVGAAAGLGTSVGLDADWGWVAGAPDHQTGSGRVLFAGATPPPLP